MTEAKSKVTVIDKRPLKATIQMKRNTVGRSNLIFLDGLVDVLVSLQGKSSLIHLFVQNSNMEQITAGRHKMLTTQIFYNFNE